MKRQVLNHPGSRRGNAMVEFALSFSFLFSVFTGVYQFGYTYFVYNSLETAVRGGARYASLRTYDSSTATPSDAYKTDVKNVVVYGKINPGTNDKPVAQGLMTSNVDVSVDAALPKQVTVKITGYTVDAVFTSFTFNNKPRIVFPYVGVYAPY